MGEICILFQEEKSGVELNIETQHKLGNKAKDGHVWFIAVWQPTDDFKDYRILKGA